MKSRETSNNNNIKREIVNNSKLFDRNFQNISNKNRDYDSNINRLCMERDFEKNSNDGSGSDSDSAGSITGDTFKNDLRGMPMRSQYNTKKMTYDANKYLDFNLLDTKVSKKSSKNIKYNDTNDCANNYTAFADINLTDISMTQQINPMYILNNSLEKFGSKMSNQLFNSLPNENTIFCTFGLYSSFASLYLLSKNTTEIESKKIFDFPNKNLLEESLFKMTKVINSSVSNMINIKNFFVYGNNIPHNREIMNNMNQFCIVACVDIENPQSEANKLTSIINNLLNHKMRNPITSANIANLQIMFITVAVLHPIWSMPFDRIVEGSFYSNDKEKQNKYLTSRGKVYTYFEDNDHQLLEIKCGNGDLMFGILLHKQALMNETNEKIHFYIEHAKEVSLDEVRIPIFTQDLKFRHNNTLKKIGLNSVFHGITSNIFPEENVKLHDVIQNIKIIIDESCTNNVNNVKGTHSIRKFIANKPFFYYFRLTKTNTILINGVYQG